MPILRTNPSLAMPLTKAGLRLWLNSYDPANNGTQQANNTGMNPWASKGALLNCNQGTGANQPLYITSGINGKPIVRFDGSNDFLISNVASLAVTSNFTFYFVFRLASASSTLQCLFSRGPVGSPYYAAMINRSLANGGIDFFDGTNWRASSAAIATTTDINIVGITYDNSTPIMFTYINGSQSVPTGLNNNPPTTAGNFILGGQGAASTTNFFGGDITDMLIYNVTHTSAEVNDVTRFFANFYGLNF